MCSRSVDKGRKINVCSIHIREKLRHYLLELAGSYFGYFATH